MSIVGDDCWNVLCVPVQGNVQGGLRGILFNMVDTINKSSPFDAYVFLSWTLVRVHMILARVHIQLNWVSGPCWSRQQFPPMGSQHFTSSTIIIKSIDLFRLALSFQFLNLSHEQTSIIKCSIWVNGKTRSKGNCHSSSLVNGWFALHRVIYLYIFQILKTNSWHI